MQFFWSEGFSIKAHDAHIQAACSLNMGVEFRLPEERGIVKCHVLFDNALYKKPLRPLRQKERAGDN